MRILTLFLTLFLIGCSQSIQTSSKLEDDLLHFHNTERVNSELDILTIDPKLSKYAQNHAEEMAKSKKLYHSRMSDLQKVCGKSYVGENIAYNQKTPKEVTKTWMNSYGHRENILYEKYSKVGFGKSEDYWCVVFSN